MNSKIPRYLPKRDLPPYAFIPGKQPHPEKKGGHMEGIEVEVEALNPDKPFENEAYLYGLDLFNHGYYWESHVWWEALWNEAGRKGVLADFLKALIKLAAGGVKINLSDSPVAQGHIDRALELLNPIEKEHSVYCGIDVTALIKECQQLGPDSPFKQLKLVIS
jgi:predicted metal-dependent hydrolase